MAKKNIVKSDDKKKKHVVKPDTKNKSKPGKDKKLKKKKHGCRNCLISLLVFVVVICAGIYFTGDFFTRKYLDMSLASCIGVVHDLRSAKAKKIVTNGYGDDDYRQFNTELRNQLFLNDSADFSVDKFITALMDNTSEDEGDGSGDGAGEGEETAKSVAAKRDDYLTRSVAVLNAGVNTDGLVSELTELYVKENLDTARLSEYSPASHDKYVMHVTDKMLASALGKSIDSLQNAVAKVGEMMEKYDIANLSDVIKLDQIIFGERAGTKNGEAATVKTVTVTVSADVRKIAKTMLKEATGKNLGALVNMLLPKRFYATAVVPAEADASIENNIYINNTNDKKMNRIYKLVSGITELTGEKIDAKAKISQVMNDSVSGIMGKVNDIFPIASADNHTVNFDVFETVIDLSGLNKDSEGNLKEEDKQLHAPDMIETLSALVNSDADRAVKTEYDYNHQYGYYGENGQYKVEYVKTTNPGDEVEGKEWLDYKQLFMEELAHKYMLSLDNGTPDDKTDDVTFEELMKLFGLGGKLEDTKERELMDLFDGKKLGGVLSEPDDNQKVKIDSRMLGAILQTQIDSLVTEGGSLGTEGTTLEYVYTYNATAGGAAHNMMEAAISVSVSAILPDGNSAASIVKGLIGDKIVVVFTIDVTPTDDENFPYISGSVMYNDNDAEHTDRILKTISTFASDFDKTALLAQVESPIRNAIAEMNKVLEITVCSSKIDGAATGKNLPSAIELPTVFDTIKQMVFADDDETNGEINKDITSQGIEDVLREINRVNEGGFETKYLSGTAVSDNYDSSFADILDKYYIKDKNDSGEKYTFDELFGASGIINSGSFDAQYIDFDLLYHDARDISALNPHFSAGDLAALLREKMNEDDAKNDTDIYKYLQNVKGMRITDKSGVAGWGDDAVLVMIFEVESSSLVGEADADKMNMLPADKLYLRAQINLGKVGWYDKSSGKIYEGYHEGDELPAGVTLTQYYDTRVTLNEMNDATYATTLKMMNSLSSSDSADGKKGQLDLSATACDIGSIVKAQFEKIEQSLGGGKIGYYYGGSGGISLMTVYGYIKDSTISDEQERNDTSEAAVKEALQGLALRRAGESDSQFNYSVGDIIVNAIKPESESPVINGVNTKLYDNQFGSGLSYGFTLGGTGIKSGAVLAKGDDGAFGLEQLNILHDGLSTRKTFVSEYLAGYGDGEIDKTMFDDANVAGKTFIEFTFAMETAKVLGSDSLLSGDRVLPANIYITIIVKETGAGFEEVYFRVNRMSKSATDTLMKIAKVDMAQIDAQIRKCTQDIARYSGAQFESCADTANGFGEITYAFA